MSELTVREMFDLDADELILLPPKDFEALKARMKALINRNRTARGMKNASN